MKPTPERWAERVRKAQPKKERARQARIDAVAEAITAEPASDVITGPFDKLGRFTTFGYWSTYQIVIVDEAASIPDDIWNVFEA